MPRCSGSTPPTRRSGSRLSSDRVAERRPFLGRSSPPAILVPARIRALHASPAGSPPTPWQLPGSGPDAPRPAVRGWHPGSCQDPSPTLPGRQTDVCTLAAARVRARCSRSADLRRHPGSCQDPSPTLPGQRSEDGTLAAARIRARRSQVGGPRMTPWQLPGSEPDASRPAVRGWHPGSCQDPSPTLPGRRTEDDTLAAARIRARRFPVGGPRMAPWQLPGSEPDAPRPAVRGWHPGSCQDPSPTLPGGRSEDGTLAAARIRAALRPKGRGHKNRRRLGFLLPVRANLRTR